ncbi:MAG TPA: aminopeptidase, partial [Anaerolineae bacterium]|nr:aminopeptidase [Anaerolineae bacterium]
MNPSDIEHNLQKYAELTVKVGLNVQPGQRLLIYAPIESAPLVRPIAACAYRLGCRFVDVIWGDDGLELTRFQSAPRDSFEEFPAWLIPAVLNYAERGDAFLQISGTDPELLKDQDPALIATVQRVAAEQFTPVRNLLVRNAMNWGIVSFPIASWAAKVFPADSPADQLSRLWAAVFEVCRVTQADPVVAWQAHARDLA